MQTQTGQLVMLKVGTLGYWHAVHVFLSFATGGGWLVIYALHAIIATATRPTVTLEVPEGGRVEYYRGVPHVLGPDEYLDVEPWYRRPAVLAVCLSPLGLAAAVLLFGALAS